MAIIIKAYRVLEMLVCGPTAHELRMAAVTVVLPTMDDLVYDYDPRERL